MDVAVRETQAALAGVEDVLLGPPAPLPLLLLPLAAIGDALRLRLDLSRPVRRWLGALPQKDVDGALHALQDEATSWSLPAVDAEDVADDSALAFVVRRRDQAESVSVAAGRSLFPRAPAPAELDALSALRAALHAVDVQLAAIVSRQEIAHMLGTRAAMGLGWAASFAGRTPPVALAAFPVGAEPGTDSDFLRAARTNAPSDEVLVAYVRDGARWQYVQGLAAESLAFGVELAVVVDAMRAQGEHVSFLARQWRKGFGGAPASHNQMCFAAPNVALAAATSVEHEESRQTVRLGALGPIEAEGRLIVTPCEVTLQVFAEDDDSVVYVALGTVDAEKPSRGAAWEVTIPLTFEPVRLRVRGKGGVEIEEMLSFVAEEMEGQS